MALTVLVQAKPMRAIDATPVVVHLAGLGSGAYTHAGVNDWWAGIMSPPRFVSMLGFGQQGWTGGAIPTTGAVSFAPSDRARIDALAALVWDGAEITIWTGDDAAADPVWTTELVGTVAGVAVQGGVMTITVADLSAKLSKPIAADRFAGTGGIEGGTEARERIKRRSFGACWGVEARLIDKAANIYEVGDPARPLFAIDAVKDRGLAGQQVVVAWAGSVAATLDALKAASVPQGGAAVAPSIACVRWWTQPFAPLTVDLRGEVGTGYVETVAEIAGRVAGEAGLPMIDVAAATAIRPGQAGLHVDGDAETFAQALDRLLLRASLLWLLEPAGAVRLMPIGYDAAAPIVEGIEAAREASYKPVTRLVLGYRRNHRQHNDGEISAAFQASDGTYADGTPIEELKPAVRSADVTSANTAAAFFGQGALATLNFLGADRVGFVTGGGNLVRNSSFDGPTYPAVGIAFPAGWSPYDNSFPADQTIWQLVVGRRGGLALRTRWEGGGPGQQPKGVYLADATIPNANIMRPGRTYVVSFYAYGQGGALGQMPGLTWNVVPAKIERVSGGVLTADYARHVFRLTWGAQADPNLFFYVHETTGPSGFVIDDVQIEEGDVVTAYSAAFLPGEVGFSFLSPTAVRLGANVVRSDGLTSATESMLITALGIASAFSGQGALATINSISQEAHFGGNIALRLAHYAADDRFLAASRMAWDITGGTVQSLKPAQAGSDVTGTNTASGITGQGILATLNAADWGTRISGRPQMLIDTVTRPGHAMDAIRADYIVQGVQSVALVDRWPQEGGANVTETRIASSITGQGGLATANTIGFDSQLSDLIAQRLTPYAGDVRFLAASRMAWDVTGGTVQSLKPAQAGSDVTGLNTASAIAGQGTFATRSHLSLTNETFFGADQRFAAASYGQQWFQASNVAWGFGTGSTVQEWKPGEPNANVTEGRTAAAIAGQSYLATNYPARLYGSPDYGDGYLSAFNVMYHAYQGGGRIGDLRPGEYGANVTEGRTAAAFLGQGALATISSIGQDSYFSGSIAQRLAPYAGDDRYLAASRMAWDVTGGTVQSLKPAQAGSDVTGANTASAIAGQGALATENRIQGDSQLGGAIANRLTPYPGDHNFLGAGRIAWNEGDTLQNWKPGEAGANRTEGRTAAGIVGQSYLATNYPDRLAPSPQHGGAYLAASAVAFAAGETTESLRPGEAGSNRTEGRTAAAIAGQGALATAPQIGSWNVASYYNFSAFKLDYSITRSDGVSIVTEALSITQYGVAAAFAGQGTLATKNQAGAGDLAPSAVQQLAYTVLQQTITCAIGN